MYGKGRAIVWTGEGANFGEFGELGGWGGVRKGGLRGRGAELAGDGVLVMVIENDFMAFLYNNSAQISCKLLE